MHEFAERRRAELPQKPVETAEIRAVFVESAVVAAPFAAQLSF